MKCPDCGELFFDAGDEWSIESCDRCRVENCEHPIVDRAHGRIAYRADLGRHQDMRVNICQACDAWLPLGPSDETPVAVEIRAAELAEPGALLRNGHEGNGRCDVGDDWYSDHDEYPDDWHAGYLARVIATHGEDQ